MTPAPVASMHDRFPSARVSPLPSVPAAAGDLQAQHVSGSVPGAGRLVLYALPAGTLGFTTLLVGIYLMKHSTDVLAIAPATLGLWFGASRIWDAVSDPVLGLLSDRTRSRFGRRRPWMCAGVVPMGIAFWLIWSPPGFGLPTHLWVGLGLIAFYTGLTAIEVPHSALGAELCDDYHGRTRVFGARRLVAGLGTLVAVGAMALLTSTDDPLAVGTWIAAGTLLFSVVAVAAMSLGIREREEFRDRGPDHPATALTDVWRNGHARILLGVFGLQQIGVAMLMATMPFLSEYVLETPDFTFAYIGTMMVSTILSIPIWLRVAPHFDKRTLVLVQMVVIGTAVGLLGFLPPGMPLPVFAVSVVAGLAVGGADVLFPSLQADIIDVDELETGERKEGAYFAVWAFAAKTASGLGAMAVGFALDAMDFAPNQSQSVFAREALGWLGGLGPAAFYALGGLVFARFFRLDAAASAGVRRALDARRSPDRS